jgi:hypothetical protein
MSSVASLALAFALLAAPALAQPPQPLGPAATRVPAQPSSMVLADGTLVGPANPLPTRDPDEAPVTGFLPIPGPGVPVAPGRGIAAVCSGTGQASFVAPDGSSLAVPLNAGFNQFGFAVAEVAPGSSASCTYTNLK